MKQQRRTFTKEFKTEICKQLVANPNVTIQLSKERNISIPLLLRWKNDYVAQTGGMVVVSERRKDYKNEMELKALIADLYIRIDNLTRAAQRGLSQSRAA